MKEISINIFKVRMTFYNWENHQGIFTAENMENPKKGKQ